MHKEENIQKKLIIDTLILDSIIFALLCIFCFFSLYQIPLGFLLGAVISIINHILLCFQTDAMINPNLGSAAVGIAVGSYLTRFILYGVGLFLGFFLDHIGIPLFAWYMVLIGYLVIKAIIVFKYSKYTKKRNTNNS